jgi:hypothetical protein
VRDTDPRHHQLARGLILLGELDRLGEVGFEDGRISSAAAFDERSDPAFGSRSLALPMSDDGRDDLLRQGVEEVRRVEGAAVDDEGNVLGYVSLGVELTDCNVGHE